MESLLNIGTYNSYPAFGANQVLTDSQLNDLRDYLDQQNRLTRVRTAGVGIVCGLHTTYQYNDGIHQITLCSGYGITSDGFIAELKETVEYTHYRCYPGVDRNNDKKDDYGWLIEIDPKSDQVLELFSEAQDQKGTGLEDNRDNPVRKLTGAAINNHVLVLFIELNEQESDPCVITQCNNQGHNIGLNVKALLVDKALIGDTDEDVLDPVPVKSSPLSQAVHVPSLASAIPVLWPDMVPKGRAATIYEHGIDNCILLDLFPEKVDNITISTQDKIDNLNAAYGCISEFMGKEFLDIEISTGEKKTGKLRGAYDRYKEFLNLKDLAFEKIYDCLEIQLTDKFDSQYSQYYYDYVRDLACAYNEFTQAVCRLSSPCFLPTTFPRHLFINCFEEVSKDEDYDIVEKKNGIWYRHCFMPAATKNVQYEEWENARKLFLRIMKMIACFSETIATSNFGTTSDPKYNNEEFPIKITPSQTEGFPIGQRAIPFYYNLLNDKRKTRFIDCWQPTLACSIDEVLNYYDNDTVIPESDPNSGKNPFKFPSSYLSHPLSYAYHKTTFWRIEGHIGKDIVSAYTEISQIKKAFNLDFGTVILTFDEASRDAIQDETSANVSVLGKFVNSCCGMIHTGGVPLGGTFIMIVNDQREIVADFSMMGKQSCCSDEKECVNLTATVSPDGERSYVTLIISSSLNNSQLQVNWGEPNSTQVTASLGSNYYDYPRSSSEDITYTITVTATLDDGTTCSESTTVVITQYSEEEYSFASEAESTTREAPEPKTQNSNINLSDRRTDYLTEVMNLNSSGEFARNRTFQSVTDFLGDTFKTARERNEAYKDVVGKTTAQTNRKSTLQVKKLAYQKMLEKTWQRFADDLISENSNAISATDLPVLEDSITDLKNAGINLKKLGQNWQTSEILNTKTGKQILKLLK